jgi:hypothetical protein
MIQRTVTTSLLAGAALLVLAGGASAQSTWNVYSGSANNREGVISGCSQNATNTGNFNNAYNCTVGAAGPTQQSMTVSAWSSNSDRGNAAGINGTGANGTSTGTVYGQNFALSGAASTFASAHISAQGNSGFGGTSRLEAQTARANGDTTPLDPASPSHSFDSIAPGNFDMLLLDFGSASVVLDKIGIGWTQGDADLMVLRWTGTSAPSRPTGTLAGSGGTGGVENLNGNLWNSSSPATAGWQLVGTYGNLGTDNTTPFGGAAVNTGATQASSWWLVSAYNTTLLGSATGCATCEAGNDSFKFNFIQTSTPGRVSAPGSLALAGLALVGLGVVRRRRTATA